MSQWASFFLAVLYSTRRVHRFVYLARLYLIFFVALGLVLMLADGQVVADRLFQSAQSPPQVEPTAPPPPPPTATPVPVAPPAQPAAVPTNTPLPPPPTPTEVVAAPEVAVPPTEAIPVEATAPPAEASEAQAPSREPTEEAPLEVLTQSEPPLQPEPRRQRDSGEPVEPDGSPNFILDQIELIDTMAVSGAYVWLCCGIGLMLLTPLFFLILYVRGRSRILRDDDF